MPFQVQLRNRLVTELKEIGISQTQTLSPKRDQGYAEEGSLLLRASNSLVADHLRRGHYDYSLSVFLPECGIDTEKVDFQCYFVFMLFCIVICT